MSGWKKKMVLPDHESCCCLEVRSGSPERVIGKIKCWNCTKRERVFKVDTNGFKYKMNNDGTFSVFFDGEYIGVIFREGDLYERQSVYGNDKSRSVLEAFNETMNDYTRFLKEK